MNNFKLRIFHEKKSTKHQICRQLTYYELIEEAFKSYYGDLLIKIVVSAIVMRLVIVFLSQGSVRFLRYLTSKCISPSESDLNHQSTITITKKDANNDDSNFEIPITIQCPNAILLKSENSESNADKNNNANATQRLVKHILESEDQDLDETLTVDSDSSSEGSIESFESKMTLRDRARAPSKR